MIVGTYPPISPQCGNGGSRARRSSRPRLRVPNGDVVQRVDSVADAGGLTIVEVENESTMPVAVAFDRRDVLTERQIADVPIEGIELPPEAFVLPLGHKAVLRIAVAHGAQRSGSLPSGLATSTQVERGWLSLTERASRFVLPDGGGRLVDGGGDGRAV